MKSVALFCLFFCLSACDPGHLKRTNQPTFNSLYSAKVTDRKTITLVPNESKVGRVFMGLVTAGPIGGIATAYTEKGFSEPKAYEYRVSAPANTPDIITSQSIAEIGDCVTVIATDNSYLHLLQIIPAENCD